MDLWLFSEEQYYCNKIGKISGGGIGKGEGEIPGPLELFHKISKLIKKE